jgi:hypothetical protein
MPSWEFFTLPNGRDEITPLFRDFADVYLDFAVRHKSRGHTDASLAKVDADWDKVLAKMKRILPYQASGWGTSKVHTNAHSTESVSLKGLPGEYSADNYESSHKRTAKNPFRASNKNHMQLQMVKHVTDRLALRKAGKDYFVPTRKETALRRRVRCNSFAFWALCILGALHHVKFASAALFLDSSVVCPFTSLSFGFVVVVFRRGFSERLNRLIPVKALCRSAFVPQRLQEALSQGAFNCIIMNRLS